MQNKYDPGDLVYIIENNDHVRKLEVVRVEDGFCTIRFMDRDARIHLRENRMLPTRIAALPK